MKNKVIILIIILSSFFTMNAQVPDSLKLKGNELKQIQSLFDYYETYEENTSEKEKKDALNKFIDDTDGTVTDKEREDAFKIIDAYISADKDDSVKPVDKKVDVQEISEIEKQAEEHFNDAKNQLMNMSYSEYAEFIRKGSPLHTEKELKESYNALHKNDGKHVSIVSGDEEKTEQMKQVDAFLILENPKNYQEFRAAILVLKPDVKEDEIRKAWDNRDK